MTSYDGSYMYGDDLPKSQKAWAKFHTSRLLAALFSINADPGELHRYSYICRGDLLSAAKTRLPLIESFGLSDALARLRRYDFAEISENRVLQEHQRQLVRCSR
jgi:hypothetical protein